MIHQGEWGLVGSPNMCFGGLAMLGMLWSTISPFSKTHAQRSRFTSSWASYVWSPSDLASNCYSYETWLKRADAMPVSATARGTWNGTKRLSESVRSAQSMLTSKALSPVGERSAATSMYSNTGSSAGHSWGRAEKQVFNR